MQRITCWQTDDGKIHKTPEEAASHENIVKAYKQLDDIMVGPFCNLSSAVRNNLRDWMIMERDLLVRILTF